MREVAEATPAADRRRSATGRSSPTRTRAGRSTVFGEPDVERLWEAVATAVRLDEPDPVAAWREHIARLEQRAAALNERRFDALRYRGPGTDLTIGLHPGVATGRPRSTSRAGSSTSRTCRPRRSSRRRTPAASTARSARRCRSRSRATSCATSRCASRAAARSRCAPTRARTSCATHVATDDGAARLGEVALVDGHSRVGKTGLVFYDTLFDENAAVAHRARRGDRAGGRRGAASSRAEERHERGVNHSSIHTDFMIGSNELEVDGVAADGEAVAILRDGDWFRRRHSPTRHSIGTVGFEPPASCSQSRRSNQAELRPVAVSVARRAGAPRRAIAADGSARSSAAALGSAVALAISARFASDRPRLVRPEPGLEPRPRRRRPRTMMRGTSRSCRNGNRAARTAPSTRSRDASSSIDARARRCRSARSSRSDSSFSSREPLLEPACCAGSRPARDARSCRPRWAGSPRSARASRSSSSAINARIGGIRPKRSSRRRSCWSASTPRRGYVREVTERDDHARRRGCRTRAPSGKFRTHAPSVAIRSPTRSGITSAEIAAEARIACAISAGRRRPRRVHELEPGARRCGRRPSRPSRRRRARRAPPRARGKRVHVAEPAADRLRQRVVVQAEEREPPEPVGAGTSAPAAARAGSARGRRAGRERPASLRARRRTCRRSTAIRGPTAGSRAGA